MNDVLAPLAARYASWLAMPAQDTVADAQEDPAEVRAMPVILRMERAAPPTRTDLLAAAAAAAVLVCLDPLAGPDGPWHEPLVAWTGAHIRKVSRRARGAHWSAVAELPGRTVIVGSAEVRALVPGRVVDLPKEVSRLQITGSELPLDEPPPVPAGVPVLWLDPDVTMTAGKAAAQVGHGTLLLAALVAADGRDDDLARWVTADCRCAVRTATRQQWRELDPAGDPLRGWRRDRVVAVRDAGFTEVAPGTTTVLAQWP